MFRAFCASLALLGLVACTDTSRPERIEVGPGVTGYSPVDNRMNSAIASARVTLPKALSVASTGSNSFSSGLFLKVDFPSESGAEVIWVRDISRAGSGQFSGKLDNEPFGLPGKRLGSSVRFAETAISDWALPAGDGKAWGNYTTRVIAKDSSPDRRRALMSTLTSKPTPADW